VTIVIGSFVVVAQPRFGELAKEMVVINVGLAVFNMLPIPPLDGASILRRVLGISEEAYFGISRWSGFIMLFVLNFGASQRVITNLVALSCVPYAWLCAWINPTAFLVIFRS
jgi:Zn-dependent protease